MLRQDRERVIGGMVVAARERRDWRDEYRIQLPSGVVRWVQSRCALSPSWRPMALPFYRYLAGRHLAQRSRTTACAKSPENIPVAVFQYCFDEQGKMRVTFVSHALEAIVGISAEQVMLDSDVFFKLMHVEDMEAFRTLLEESDDEARPWTYEHRLTQSEAARRCGCGPRHVRAFSLRAASHGTVIWPISRWPRRPEELQRPSESAEAASRAKSDSWPT